MMRRCCKQETQKEAFPDFLTVFLGVAVTLFSSPRWDVFRLFDRLKSLASMEQIDETQVMHSSISLPLLSLLKKKTNIFLI